MLCRFRSLLVSSVVWLAPMAAGASPITYDFTGQLDQPIQGVSQFSGSFTVDSNPSFERLPGPPTNGSPGSSTGFLGEVTSDVSMTVHLGGQTILYQNDPAPGLDATLMVNSYTAAAADPSVRSRTSVDVSGNVASNLPWPSPGFSIAFSRPGPVFTPADLANLASAPFSSRVEIRDPSGGQALDIHGTLTSIEEVPAPEPGSLAIFGGMAVAAYFTGRRRAGGRTGGDGRRAGPRASRG